jgi:hypothetical protein
MNYKLVGAVYDRTLFLESTKCAVYRPRLQSTIKKSSDITAEAWVQHGA